MAAICVGRDKELQSLKHFLGEAISGKFQICFISGEAGSGKTTLLKGFTEVIDKTTPDAIVAFGECDAQIGISDPYLPFKEILANLTGDTEGGKSKGKMSRNATQNLGKFAALSIETLLEIGPDLVGSVLPGGTLIALALKAFSEKSEVLKKLKKRLDAPLDVEVNQSTIFQEYTNVLVALSKKKPLVIFLDDLHWVDNASSALLFHLSRKLTSSKILIVGTYRPNEIYATDKEVRHPMEVVINETRRYFGDIIIDLDEKSKKHGQDFVNALIDSDANRLPAEFREKIFSLTEANALFTSELLRNLREKGDLVQDASGKWVEKATINWQEIPPRVEGVIKERISRLEKELREFLSVASVEGENFTAQVISRLEALDERLVVRELTNELEKKHRLVMEDGEMKVGANFLSLFRFSHSLIHKYLYNELGLSERRILHKQVAQTLEFLYQNQIEVAATQLARHYEEAGDTEKAVHYLRIAADKALKISAFKDARSLLEKALKLGTAELDTLSSLNLLLGMVFFGMGDYPSSRVHLETSLQQNQTRNENLSIANAKFHLSRTLAEIGNFESAEKHARDCIDIAKSSGEDEMLIRGISQLGYVMYMVGEVQQAEKLLEKSLRLEKKLEKQIGLTWKAHSLYTLGSCEIVMKNPEKAEAAFLEGISISRESGNREVESYCLTDLGYVIFEKGDYERARSIFEEGLKLGAEIDAQWTIAEAQCGLGYVSAVTNKLEEAKTHLQKSLSLFDASKTFTGSLLAIVGFAMLFAKQNKYNEALQLIGLSRNYSSPIADIDHFADLILDELKNQMKESAIRAGIKQGKKRDFDQTIAELLNDSFHV